MMHKVTKIPKRGAGGGAPTWYGPARARRDARRPPVPPPPEVQITHLVNHVGARATACGLTQGSPKMPYAPYVLARYKATYDAARIKANTPAVNWCPACLAHYGWPNE